MRGPGEHRTADHGSLPNCARAGRMVRFCILKCRAWSGGAAPTHSTSQADCDASLGCTLRPLLKSKQNHDVLSQGGREKGERPTGVSASQFTTHTLKSAGLAAGESAHQLRAHCSTEDPVLLAAHKWGSSQLPKTPVPQGSDGFLQNS